MITKCGINRGSMMTAEEFNDHVSCKAWHIQHVRLYLQYIYIAEWILVLKHV